MTMALTRQEQSDLRACEQVISKGINTFRDVGKALAKIREEKLYKGEYKTFENYCTTRWGFSRVHAHRLIEAADVPEMLPNGNKIESEGAARKYLDERKAESKPKPAAAPKTVVAELVSDDDHHPVADDSDDDQDTSGGAAPVSSGPLAGMDPDHAGADSDGPQDRIAWMLEQLDLLWADYRATFHADADWMHWRMAQEAFAVKMGHD